MIRAALYGRLGAEPVERQTKTGKAMVTASLAVSAGRPDADEETVWISLAAFGRAAETVARHVKGDLVAAMGPLYRTRFTGRDGQDRQGWSLTVESVVSARTVRPSGGRKRAEAAKPAPAGTSADDGVPFDDQIPQGAP